MKKTNLILIFTSMLILLAIGASAVAPTCTITTPASSSTNYGVKIFSASITSNGTAIVNVSGVNFTIGGVVVGSNLTFGANKSVYSSSVNTATLSDSTGETVTANIIVNNTVYHGSCTSTGVIFDNTAPVCSCRMDKSSVNIFKPLGYDCSLSSDTITAITYSCITTYSDSSTETKTSQAADFVNTNALGQASTVCTITDSAVHSTACSALTTDIVGKDQKEVMTPTGKSTSSSTVAVIFILVAAIIVVVIALGSTKKGKKRKR